ncbi:MAG: Re/Si-specific NAD(P)(+) transhydrogenase subunit alpha [Actinobacteria bacterium]|jgi:NAD(P) transhydrogenase subunit alpha|nr:Re/Si-specific NAD(P)(+) transhydrogenase subunit alpha [Actinomycetota bacterium]
MLVFIPAETRAGERRVGLTPEGAQKLIKLGLTVSIQEGAGQASGYHDDEYKAAGASVAGISAISTADVVATVRPLENDAIGQLKSGAITISFLSPANDAQTVKALADKKVTALSFDVLPRISRAQSMDALTSQALCAGYRTVLIAAERAPKFFPMLMTAAGTIPAAKVLVLGAGVAGLQAMATAKRLGAIVSAYDVRASSADEVKSMGATFLDLGLDEVEGSGGYAREMTPERAKAQQDALKKFISASDVVITTAAVPGRKAPTLITTDMMSEMKPGAIIVDLAAESGGNVDGSVAGEDVVVNVPGGSITLIGCKDLASQLAVHASKLYAQNVVSLLTLMTAEGVVTPDEEDEVVQGSAVVFNGEIRNAMAREALNLPALATGKGE